MNGWIDEFRVSKGVARWTANFTPPASEYGPATPPPSSEPVTITYDYDLLYRLTAADYSTGDYYHYTYDAVGNRLTQTSMVSGLSSTVAYLYDDANRLTNAGGVTYSWDANGNLLSDGVNTYTYDSANRLKTLTGSSVSASYGYNGLNDRLQETLNGQTTTFTMDLNMGLTQALSDGTNTYLYGNGRIAQVNTGTEYFLGDALGSVRQLTDGNGAITYASAYDPYGVTTQTYGASETVYGFTGEYTSNDMVYLRARYYAPGMGRFLTRDTWGGDANSPMSFNRWSYVDANPINFTDPTGLITKNEAADADDIVKELKVYRVFVKVDWGERLLHNIPLDTNSTRPACAWHGGEWTLWELQQLRKAVKDTARAMGGYNAFVFNYEYINVEKRLLKGQDPSNITDKARGIAHLIAVNSNYDNEANNWSIVHELGHVWDGNNNWKLSDGLVATTKEYVDKGYERKWGAIDCTKDPGQKLPGCNTAGYFYYDVLASGANEHMNKKEDFANSFAAYVYPVDSQGRIEKYLQQYRGGQYAYYLYYTDYTQTLRYRYIDSLVIAWNETRKK